MEPIQLYNRKTQTLEQEAVFGQKLVEFVYNTKLGAFLHEHILKRRFFSQAYGWWQDLPWSSHGIASFVRTYGIDLQEMEKPLDQYTSFNEFFTRRLKPDARPIDPDPNVLISPADARLSVRPIERGMVVPVIGRHFGLQQLFRGHLDPEAFEGGSCLVFRLAPVDYHRFCYPASGEHDPILAIDGYYCSVNPIALWKDLNVFPENFRTLSMMRTTNFGTLAYLEVGALGVGRVVLHSSGRHAFTRGEEKGYLEFGGSTVIVLTQPHMLAVDEDILRYSNQGIETRVRYGSRVGAKPS